MKNNDYQMVTVCEYVKMLDEDNSTADKNTEKVKSNVEKYLLSMRRASTNAKILESLLD